MRFDGNKQNRTKTAIRGLHSQATIADESDMTVPALNQRYAVLLV